VWIIEHICYGIVDLFLEEAKHVDEPATAGSILLQKLDPRAGCVRVEAETENENGDKDGKQDGEQSRECLKNVSR